MGREKPVRVHPDLYTRIKEIQMEVYRDTGAPISFVSASKILERRLRAKKNPFGFG